MWKNYICTASIDETLALLSENKGKAKLISGGTDLVLELERGLYPQNELLIDVSRIAGLDEISLDTAGVVHLGAMVTHSHVVGSRVVQEATPLLVQACLSVGSPQIRNRGTLVGNVVTGSPANDTISPLIALDASLKLQSRAGTRLVRLAEFYTGVRKTVLQPDEMVVEIFFKRLEKNQKSLFKKYALRKAQAISLVNASILLTLKGEVVEQAAITLGSVTPTIIHARNAESALIGKKLDEKTALEAAECVKLDISPISDIRSSSDYRKKIAALLIKRGLEELSDGTQEKSIQSDPVLLWGESAPNKEKLQNSTSGKTEKKTIDTILNGMPYHFENGQEKTLLHLIREEAGLVGTKEGCSEGECGACTVFMDGVAVMSCLVPAPRANGATIVTIEGIADGQKLHPVQQAFINEGAVQCGYCTPGFVMSAVKLFEEKKNPDIDEIKMAITGNLCRCTGYYKIVKAIESVAQEEGQ